MSHEDEQHAHEHRGDGQELAKDGHLGKDLEVVQVVRQHHHHRRGCHTHQEGELGDVEAPHHVPAQAGDAEAFAQLPQVGHDAHADDGQQDRHPTPVPSIAL